MNFSIWPPSYSILHLRRCNGHGTFNCCDLGSQIRSLELSTHEFRWVKWLMKVQNRNQTPKVSEPFESKKLTAQTIRVGVS